MLGTILDVVPVCIYVCHDLVDPDLLQIVLIVCLSFLILCVPVDLIVLAEGF